MDVANINNQRVYIAKFKGEYKWHKHECSDEFFHVLSGNITIETEDKSIELQQGECAVIPKNTLHKPFAINEANVLMISES